MKARYSKTWYIRNYNKLSAADYYIIGFEQDNLLYIVSLDKIPPRFIIMDSKGIRIKKFSCKDKKYMINKGAKSLGPISLIHEANKGMGLERVVKELYGQTYKGHDTTPWYKTGDMVIERKQVQVKYDRGHMVNHSTLVRAVRRHSK